MAKKDNYTALVAEISEKVKANGSHSHSKTDLVSMAQTMINTPEHEVDLYMASGEDKPPTVVSTTPVKAYRDSLKGMLKTFGVDSAEAEKLDTMPLSKKHAEALTDISINLVKDYTSTGRKLSFPVTSKDESRMSISQVEIDQKITEPKKIVKDEKTGKYNLVSTGTKVTTKKHAAMKASNKVPYWLKDIK